MKQYCLFASDVAALIGKNRYSTSASIKVKLWQKSNKRLFDRCKVIADGKTGYCLKTEDTKALETILAVDSNRKRKTSLSISKIASSSGIKDITSEIQNLVSSDTLLNSMGPVEKKQKMLEVEQKCQTAVDLAISETVKGIRESDALVIEDILKTKSPKKAKVALLHYGVSISDSDKLIKDVNHRTSTFISKNVMVPSIEECIRSSINDTSNISKTKVALHGLLNGVHNTDKYVTSEINKGIGVSLENKSIDLFERKSHQAVVERNTNSCTKMIPYNYGTLVLYGKVDGLQGDDTVVEVKQRVNRLFGQLVQRERIQLMVYMYLTGRSRGVLVETFEGKQNSYPVQFNLNDWTDIQTEIINQINDLHKTMYIDEEDKRVSLIKEVFK
jgi:hypothetical protein